MELSTGALIAVGCAGGLLPDIVRLIKGRYEEFPGYLKSASFWIGLALLAGIGGLAAWWGAAGDAKEALAYGYSAPELLSRLASKATRPPDRGDRDRQPAQWRQWFAK